MMAAEVKNSDCLECHGDKTMSITNVSGENVSLFVDEAKFAASAHKTKTCAACHNDIKATHPDDNTRPKPVDCARCHEQHAGSYGQSVHGKALAAGEKAAPNCVDCHGKHEILPSTSPSSPLYFSNLTKTCGQCHSEVALDVAQSVHGKAVAQGRREAATCLDCHAEHKIEGLKNKSSLAISQDVCSKCHASAQMNTKYNLPTDRVKTFFESYHGLAAQKGSTTAANCSSCHGVHKILSSSDPRSTVNKANLVATCGKCHPGANANFAQAQMHVDLTYGDGSKDLGQRVNWWVRKIYLGLIFVVIGGMFLHNGLIFFRKVSAKARLENRTIVRMDFFQRAQHATLAISFILLAWTGFALKYPDSWIGHFIISNEVVRSWTHRIAGLVLLAVGVCHVGYLIANRQGRRLAKDMLPKAKDLRDVVGNANYLTGLTVEKPKFGRFGYAEKMEYWAVMWGTIVMGLTGLAIRAKVPVTHVLPRWMVDVCTNVHFYEAVLACLAIVVWHFYHVMFDPDIYPLNRASLDGRVSPEWQHEEHPLDHSTGSSARSSTKKPKQKKGT